MTISAVFDRAYSLKYLSYEDRHVVSNLKKLLKSWGWRSLPQMGRSIILNNFSLFEKVEINENDNETYALLTAKTRILFTKFKERWSEDNRANFYAKLRLEAEWVVGANKVYLNSALMRKIDWTRTSFAAFGICLTFVFPFPRRNYTIKEMISPIEYVNISLFQKRDSRRTQSMLDNKDRFRHFALISESEIISAITAGILNEKIIFLMDAYTLEPYRRKGLQKYLVSHVLDSFKDKKYVFALFITLAQFNFTSFERIWDFHIYSLNASSSESPPPSPQ